MRFLTYSNDEQFTKALPPIVFLQMLPLQAGDIVGANVITVIGADECAAGNPHIFRRHDHTETIARGIEAAPVNHHIMPITASHTVISRREITLTHIDTLHSSDMDTVPAAGNPEAIELAVREFIAKNRVIR